MKFLRTVALVLAALIVILAQFLLSSTELIRVVPARLFDLLPFLRPLTLWPEGNLQILALLLMAGGALVFGLLVQPWDATPVDPQRMIYARWSRAGYVLVWLATALGVGLAVFTWRNDGEPLWLLIGWMLALILMLSGAALATAQHMPVDDRVDLPVSPSARPEATWPMLFMILILTGLLTGWHLADLPVQVSAESVAHGLQAKALVTGAESRVFAPGWDNLPLFAFYPSALAIAVSRDTLLGSRIAGLFAGLLTVLGVWLLGCELFRRPPVTVDGLAWQDDGRRAALCAAAFTAIGYTFIHFSRQPLYLEPVAWGTLSLWALHRGLRTHSRFVLALSGLLLGVSALFYFTGWIFLGVALLWWIWIAFGRRHWLRGEDGVGWAGVAIWLAALYVSLAPFVGMWLRLPDLLVQRWQAVSVFAPDALARMEALYAVQGLPAVLWEGFRRSLLTINFYPDTSRAFGFAGPMFDPLIGALVLLGLGVIVLNLDRLLSWLLLSWLGLGLIIGGGMTTSAPFWPYLLPALPVSGLIVGLAVDRWRATLLLTGGPWLRNLGTVVVVMGVLILAAAHNWVSYYERYTLLDASPTETAIIYTGRALRTLSPGQTPFLVVGADRPSWDDPRVEYLAGRAYDVLPHGELRLETLPDRLPNGGAVLLLPEDQVLASALQSRFPDGQYGILRDRRGNPVMVIYGDWGSGTGDWGLGIGQ